MKRLIFIPLLILTLLCNAQFTNSGGTFLKTGSSFMTATATGEGNGLLTNLVAYYDMEDASGGITDKVNGYNGSESGNPLYHQTGKVGYCITFDGTDDHFTMSTEEDDLKMGTSDFTFAAWIYMPDLPAASATLGIIGGATNAAVFDIYDDQVRLRIEKASVNSAYGFYEEITADAWHFVAVVFDSNLESNNALLYLDGDTEAVTLNYDFLDSGSVPIATNFIGRGRTTSHLWIGSIDEVAIWKGRKLTTDELNDLYNSGNGRAFSYYEN